MGVAWQVGSWMLRLQTGMHEVDRGSFPLPGLFAGRAVGSSPPYSRVISPHGDPAARWAWGRSQVLPQVGQDKQSPGKAEWGTPEPKGRLGQTPGTWEGTSTSPEGEGGAGRGHPGNGITSAVQMGCADHAGCILGFRSLPRHGADARATQLRGQCHLRYPSHRLPGAWPCTSSVPHPQTLPSVSALETTANDPTVTMGHRESAQRHREVNGKIANNLIPWSQPLLMLGRCPFSVCSNMCIAIQMGVRLYIHTVCVKFYIHIIYI